jgi:hypothetical protein
MTEEKRKQLKAKVAAREATLLDRAGEKAIEARDAATGFARRHPLTTVAGALVVGVLVSALFKRSPTRKLGAMAAGKAGALAAVGADLALVYAQQALAAAESAGRAGAAQLDGLGDTARHLGHEAADRAASAGAAAQAATRQAGKRISRVLRNRVN